MKVNDIKLLLLLLLVLLFWKAVTASSTSPPPSSPYQFPSTFTANYNHMLLSLKIFVYNSMPSSSPHRFSSPVEALFYDSLLRSPFVTPSPDEAHLFFVPFSSISIRSLARLLRSLKSDLPYWNRTLGSDHFYLSCPGLAFNPDRGLLELKKNSVQVTCFPSPSNSDQFVPHKDVTLVPRARHSPNESVTAVPRRERLAYAQFGTVKSTPLLEGMGKDVAFLVESSPSDTVTWRNRMASSEFCVFEYGEGDFSSLSDAVRLGCVPAVITDRPMSDLPLSDVLRWQEIGVFVGKDTVRLRRVLGDLAREEGKLQIMRRLGADASRHLLWNEASQPLDAFHMVMYQLWLRRHAIRYERRFDLVD